MNKVTDVLVKSLQKSQFVVPFTLHYTQNGVRKTWDLVKLHDSVAILIYNTSRKVVVLVKQFRPAVFYATIPVQDKKDTIDTDKYPAELGMTIELCAGIVDKDKSLEEIASEEVFEECGYEISASSLKRIISYRSGVGVSGDAQTIFYAEVTDDMRVNQGGGNPEEGEFIEVVEMTIPEVRNYISGTVLSPGGCLFALHWFLHSGAIDKTD